MQSMASGFRHVSYKERCMIEALKKEGLSPSQIAKHLAHSQSTICRGLARNSVGRGYRPY